MFRAIARFFKSIGYLLTGKVDNQTRNLNRDANVIRAKFDEIGNGQRQSVRDYTSAIATIISQQEKKKQRLHKLSEEQVQIERRKSGAIALAKKTAADLKKSGKTSEEIKQDPTYTRCLAGFQDLSSSFEKVVSEISELENDIQRYQEQINNHKVNLTRLKNRIEKTKKEAADTVADVISAQEERKMNEVLAGISVDGTARELEEMREMRNQVKAEARVTSELAGTDVQNQMAEFDSFALESTASDEFADLIGLEDDSVSETPVNDTESRESDGTL